MRYFVEYLRLIRFSHTLFALPFALLGGAMAVAANLREPIPIFPRSVDFIGMLLCMVFARSAAMAFNRLVDRKIDALNPRTQGRHLPSGRMSVAGVSLFTGFCSVCFVLSTLLFLPNTIPILFSLPVLGILLGYSYAKRFTVFAHLWLGLALGLSPIAAWIVFRPSLWPLESLAPPLCLGAAVLFWTAGFDVIYALQDADYDRQFHLFSLPGNLGTIVALRIAALFHGVMLAALLLITVYYPELGKIWFTGVCAVAGLLVAEHWLIRPVNPLDPLIEPGHYTGKKIGGWMSRENVERQDPGLDLERINIAFFQMNWIISVGLLLVGLADIYF